MSEQNPYRPDYCIQDPGDCKWTVSEWRVVPGTPIEVVRRD